MNKKIIISLLVVIGLPILFFGFYRAGEYIIEGVQKDRAEKQLQRAKDDRAKCEELQKLAHDDAEEARAKLEELSKGEDFTQIQQDQKLSTLPTTLTGLDE